ncbi:MAG: class I SAM-dependent methyltransferase, partial [Bdellovibrionales bacterium]|nr:class I SAM-dependent methyltransferase [Bdellovibrionales bacterium]
MSDSKKSLSELSALMKNDWDRRLDHDYRFWMSDGYENDEAMWSSGERDYEIITKGLDDCATKTQLELGCGVGRLLRPALRKFRKVIGVDVSEKAVKKATSLLGEKDGLELIVGNGFDLASIPDSSVDVALSFAAITSIPTDIIANYFREIHRVLKRDGIFRLQCYLGRPQEVSHDDTLHIRCYAEDSFRAAMKAAGFTVESIEELVLPFQVSFKEIGITAMIVSLKRETVAPESSKEISRLLLPTGESTSTEVVDSSDLETWMSLNYAKKLVRQGDLAKAEETVQFVANSTRNTAIDVQDLLQKVISEVEKETDSKVSVVKASSAEAVIDSELFRNNYSVLKERFPHVAKLLLDYLNSSNPESIELRSSEEGLSLFCMGQCLDHPTKPVSAAKKWAELAVRQYSVNRSDSILVYGFASGKHIYELLKITEKKVAVYEPSLAVLRIACENFELREVFNKLSDFWVGKEVTDSLPENAELIIRPQTQAVEPLPCAELKSKLYGVRGFKELNPKIGVLGPLMGGTLDMTTSVGRSLVTLDQRVNLYDMREFAGGYNDLNKFVKNAT